MNLHQVSILFTAEEIARRVKSLAEEIAGEIEGDTVIVALLRGSFIFAADLVREMHYVDFHPQIDFMTLSSYGSNTESSGSVNIQRDITTDLEGKNVLIVDDILESGRTLSFAKHLLKDRGAKEVKVAVLLEKPGKKVVKVEADFVGFRVPDRFVVGYGLDCANFYRELPYIGILDLN